LLLMVPEALLAVSVSGSGTEPGDAISQRLAAPRSSALLEELRVRMTALRDDVASWCYV
jgi:hypothetical protein